jgi:hypothetical protein
MYEAMHSVPPCLKLTCGSISPDPPRIQIASSISGARFKWKMMVKRTVGMEHTLVVGTMVHPLRSSLTSWSNLSQALHLPYTSTGSSQKNLIARVLSEGRTRIP